MILVEKNKNINSLWKKNFLHLKEKEHFLSLFHHGNSIGEKERRKKVSPHILPNPYFANKPKKSRFANKNVGCVDKMCVFSLVGKIKGGKIWSQGKKKIQTRVLSYFNYQILISLISSKFLYCSCIKKIFNPKKPTINNFISTI